jgi:hypothetical protein
LRRKARKARTNAELDGATREQDWYKAEIGHLDSNANLTDEERTKLSRDLLLELGRRTDKAMRKARRDNSVTKLIQRQARDEINEHLIASGLPPRWPTE